MSQPIPTFIAYSFPLRGNFTAQLVLPTDLTTAEAKRLQAFLETLITPNTENQDNTQNQERDEHG